jgi:endonuclease YncB( thermonuclease family)
MMGKAKLKLMAVAFGLAVIATAIALALPEPVTQASIPHPTITGRVIHISDGDSITVRAGEANIKVRLAQIDAPETGQPWGTRAKQDLQSLIAGRDVTLTITDEDRYGRLVAQVQNNNVDINRMMIARGAAWVYTAYATDPSLVAVEADARARQAGLWSMPERERVPPWEYRRAKRQAREIATAR